jgi:hypothetical protein
MLALPCMRLWEGPLRPAPVAFALVLAVLAWGDSALLALPFKLRLPSGGLDGRPGSLGRPSSDIPVTHHDAAIHAKPTTNDNLWGRGGSLGVGTGHAVPEGVAQE